MNNADRVLRVVYRKLAQDYLTCAKSVGVSFKKPLIKHKSMFSLSDASFVEEVCSSYQEIYPNNYSKDETVKIIQEIAFKIKEDFSLSSSFINTAHIFLYFSKKLFYLLGKEILVNFDNLFEWDGFSNKVSPIVFQAAFLAQQPKNLVDDLSFNIKHDEKRLYQILSKGVYETHMHLNGSGDSAEINFYNLVCCEPITSMKAINTKNKSILKYIDKNNLLAYKIQLLRTYLQWILLGKEEAHKDLFFDIQKLLTCDSELFFFLKKEKLRLIYKKFHGLFKKSKSGFQDSIKIERDLLQQVFRLLINNELTYTDKYVLNLYISALSDVQSLFVQDNVGMGFSKFKSCEEDKEVFFGKGDSKRLIESVFAKYYSEKIIKGIEARITPKNKVELFKKLKEIKDINDKIYLHFHKHDQKVVKIKVGIIVHYIKNVEHTKLKFYCRNYKLRQKNRKLATQLTAYLQSQLTMKEDDAIKIVGIDAANTEIGCPPEVFAPIFRHHQHEISSKMNLGMTFHVGEDFINIVNGLRAIDDVVEFFNFKKGDRLGHAIALGINIDDYILTKRGYFFANLEDLVDNYAWLHKLLGEISFDSRVLRHEIELEYKKYAQQLFKGTGLEVPEILTYQYSYALRGDEPTLFIREKDNESFYKKRISDYNFKNELHNKAIMNKEARALYRAYHYNSKLYENGKEPLTIQLNEVDILSAKLAQEYLHNKIYKLGITIETNPTSNKKISPITRYDELPLFNFNSHRLTPTESQKENKRKNNLQVSINTDDSAIFQTNLSNEYSCIALALLQQGFQKEDVYEYIEHLRELSEQTSFLN